MEYRVTTPSDNGFDNETDELDAMREYIQAMMFRSSPNDLLDSVLIVVNICELRRALCVDQKVAAWYEKTAMALRAALDVLAARSHDDFKPQQKFENPVLYFPAPQQFH